MIYSRLFHFLHRCYGLGELKGSSRCIFPDIQNHFQVINFKCWFRASRGESQKRETWVLLGTDGTTLKYLVFHTIFTIWGMKVDLWILFFSNSLPERGEMMKIRGKLYKNKCLKWKSLLHLCFWRKIQGWFNTRLLGVLWNVIFNQQV